MATAFQVSCAAHVSMADASFKFIALTRVSRADAVSMPTAFNFVEGFAVLATLFLWLRRFKCCARLAYAELKVNFVELEVGLR